LPADWLLALEFSNKAEHRENYLLPYTEHRNQPVLAHHTL
jgi:hypothetical protein